MSGELSIEARNKAGSYFKEGYNCAEAVFLTFRDYYGKDIDPDMVKLFTGFGAGVGESGCMCGALVGSIAAINMIKGRTSNHDNQKRIDAYKMAGEFHNRFEEKFGATCCRVLKNGLKYGTKECLTNCLKITGNTSKMLIEFLEEEGYNLTKE